MASRSIDLGGLPPIQQGGFDVDALVKIAALMQNQHEQEMKYGTLGTPDTISTTKPLFAGLRGYQERPGTAPMAPSAPINGAEGDPSTGLMEEAQNHLLTNGAPTIGGSPTTWVKPGTPGTLGLDQLRLRTAVADQVAPEDRGVLLTDPSQDVYKKVKFVKGAPKTEVFYNAYTGHIADAKQLASIDPAQQQDYYKIDQTEAIKQAGDFWRAKLNAGSQSHADLLRLYTNELSIKLWDRTDGDRAMLKALKGVVPDILGVGGAVKLEKGILDSARTEYRTDKTNAMTVIQKIGAMGLSSSDRRSRVQGILNDLKNKYAGEEGFYDLTTKEEKSLINGD